MQHKKGLPEETAEFRGLSDHQKDRVVGLIRALSRPRNITRNPESDFADEAFTERFADVLVAHHVGARRPSFTKECSRDGSGALWLEGHRAGLGDSHDRVVRHADLGCQERIKWREPPEDVENLRRPSCELRAYVRGAGTRTLQAIPPCRRSLVTVPDLKREQDLC